MSAGADGRWRGVRMFPSPSLHPVLRRNNHRPVSQRQPVPRTALDWPYRRIVDAHAGTHLVSHDLPVSLADRYLRETAG